MLQLQRRFCLSVLMLSLGGCAGVPREDSLTAEVRYIDRGKSVEIVGAMTNFEYYRPVFLWGFTKGYAAVLGHADGGLETIEYIDFSDTAHDFFYSIGYKFGERVAREVAQTRVTDIKPTNGASPPLVHIAHLESAL